MCVRMPFPPPLQAARKDKFKVKREGKAGLTNTVRCAALPCGSHPASVARPADLCIPLCTPAVRRAVLLLAAR
jgi:hypothetical protein